MSSQGEKIWNAVKDGKRTELADLLKGRVDPVALTYEGKHVTWAGGFTAVMIAAEKGDSKMVKMLAKAGADVNRQIVRGRYSALLWASYQGHTDTIQTLLQLGAKPDIQDSNGWTALMEAAKWGKLHSVKVLLEGGADKNVKAKDGKTAADVAKTEEIKTLINNHRSSVFSWSRPAATATTGATTAAAAAAAPAPATVAPAAPVKKAASSIEQDCATLESECDVIHQQSTQVPARRDAILRRETLQALYNAARAAKPVDYDQLGKLGESQEALKLEAAQLPLSEEDYRTLAVRHAALVKKVKAKCDALLKTEQPALLVSLAAKLTMLQGLSADALGPTTAGAKPAKEAAAKPHDAAKLQRLQTECTTFTQQLANAPARKDLMQRRDELAARLKAAKAASTIDYALAGKLMLEQQALEEESGKLPLSEKDYKTMGSRHAALVQQMQGMCEDLVAARQYRLLRNLAAQLTALRALDLSVLHDASHTDPVEVVGTSADSVLALTNNIVGDKTVEPSQQACCVVQ